MPVRFVGVGPGRDQFVHFAALSVRAGLRRRIGRARARARRRARPHGRGRGHAGQPGHPRFGRHARRSELDADLFVVGPEEPLVDGLADGCGRRAQLVFGPGADGARLEGSKAWMKRCSRGRRADRALRDLRTPEDEAALAFLDDAARLLRGEDRRPGRGQGRARHRVARRGAEDAVARSSPARRSATRARRVVIEEGLTGPELSLLVRVRRRRGSFPSRPPRTTSGSATATTARTPAAWARTRPCPPWATTVVARDHRDDRRAHARLAALRTASTTAACSTPG